MTAIRPSAILVRLTSCVFLLAVSAVAATAQPLTARDVVERIKDNLGVPWQDVTVDTFKAGDPDTRVTGVAVTMMATLDVLQRAAAAGRNFVITHEPTFYDHQDPVLGLEREGDPVLAAKLAFIRQHKMVVWRFHDFSHRKRPDLVQTAVVRTLGWQAYQDPTTPWRIRIPATTLGAIADGIRTRLGANALRVVGDPALKVTQVALVPGAAGFPIHRRVLQEKDVQVLVVGEAREWETVEYVDDAVAAGQGKGLILVGHIPSEQPGMEDAAAWIRTFVTEVPVEFVAAKDPFWPSK